MKVAPLLLAVWLFCGASFASDRPSNRAVPHFSNNNELLLPKNYRSWVTVSPSAPGISEHRHHLVSKLYVEPVAYGKFVNTGVWPSETVIVLELRSDKPVPGKCDVMGLEAAVKGHSQFSDPWTYYGILYNNPEKKAETAQHIPGCRDCAPQPIDTVLAIYFPALRAVIDAKPSSMKQALF